MPLFIKRPATPLRLFAEMIALATVLFGALHFHAAYSSGVIYASYRSADIGYVPTYYMDIQHFK